MVVIGATGIAPTKAHALPDKLKVEAAAATAELCRELVKAIVNGGVGIASTKALAPLAQHNAPATAIKYAHQAANGKTLEQMQTVMQKTCNAAIPYATLLQMSMIPQKRQQKTLALTLWTTIAT